MAEIRRALLEHLVIFFRDQPLTPDELVRLARRFGRLDRYPFVEGLPDHPEIVEVVKREDERVNFGGVWHSDTTYLAEPPLGSLLLAKELPEVGGDTAFANMYLAFESLSPAMQSMLDGLVGVNTSAKPDAALTREEAKRDRPGQRSEPLTAEHPVVRTHPETGRKALFVNRGHTLRFKGFTEAESRPVLDFLFEHLMRPEHTCRFRWRPDSLAFWDNRAAQHYALNDYHGSRRVMHRVTLAGDVPR